MPKYWFDHIQLTSPDPIMTAQFYSDLLGAKNLGSKQLPDGRTNVSLLLDGVPVAVSHPRAQSLVSRGVQSYYGIDHIGLRTGDLVAAANYLKAKQVRFVLDVTPRPNSKIAFCLGPEDVLIELVERSA